jgi:hypothetical protein
LRYCPAATPPAITAFPSGRIAPTASFLEVVILPVLLLPTATIAAVALVELVVELTLLVNVHVTKSDPTGRDCRTSEVGPEAARGWVTDVIPGEEHVTDP